MSKMMYSLSVLGIFLATQSAVAFPPKHGHIVTTSQTMSFAAPTSTIYSVAPTSTIYSVAPSSTIYSVAPSSAMFYSVAPSTSTIYTVAPSSSTIFTVAPSATPNTTTPFVLLLSANQGNNGTPNTVQLQVKENPNVGGGAGGGGNPPPATGDCAATNRLLEDMKKTLERIEGKIPAPKKVDSSEELLRDLIQKNTQALDRVATRLEAIEKKLPPVKDSTTPPGTTNSPMTTPAVTPTPMPSEVKSPREVKELKKDEKKEE